LLFRGGGNAAVWIGDVGTNRIYGNPDFKV